MATLADGSYLPAENAKRVFLEKLCEVGRIGLACNQTGINTRTIYHWKRDDPEFAAMYEEAQQVAFMAMEDEAYRRAVNGVEEPIYQGGIKVGSVRKYSDSLLTLLLKANNPNKYKERSSAELTGPNGLPLGTEGKIVHVHSSVPLANNEDDILDEFEPKQLTEDTNDISSL